MSVSRHFAHRLLVLRCQDSFPETKMLFCLAYQSNQSNASFSTIPLAITDQFISLFALAVRVCSSLASALISRRVPRTDSPALAICKQRLLSYCAIDTAPQDH